MIDSNDDLDFEKEFPNAHTVTYVYRSNANAQANKMIEYVINFYKDSWTKYIRQVISDKITIAGNCKLPDEELKVLIEKRTAKMFD